MNDKRTHNIVTYEEDDAVVEAVMDRIRSTDYSAAIRFIIREFSIHTNMNLRPNHSKRNKNKSTAEKMQPEKVTA